MKNVSQDKILPEQNNLQQILFRFLPYWPLFLILLLLSLSALFYYLKTTNPVFESSTSVLIKDQRKGQEESQIEEELNTTGTKTIVENEMELLHSNLTVIEVVKNLRLYAPIFEEKGWRNSIQTPAYLTSPISIESINPDSLIPAKKIYFNFSQAANTVNIDNAAYPLNEWVNTNYGKLKFTKNTNYKKSLKINSTEEAKFFFSLINVEKVTAGLVSAIQVNPTNRLSSIISMKIKDAVPQRAEAILTEIINSYNNISIERKNTVAFNTLNFIELRLKRVSLELDSIESGIQKYRDRTGIVDIPEQSRVYLQSIGENDQQLNSINMQMSSLEEVEKYVTSKNNQGNLVLSTMNLTDPTLNQLVTKLSTAEAEYDKLKHTTAENNPVLISLQEVINKTKPSILENIKNQKNNLQSGKNLLSQNNNRYSAMLNSIPKKERELIEVSRQQTILNTTYAYLLQKREETASSISSTLPDCTIVDEPSSSPNPVSPKKPLLALVALFVPLFFGIVIISLKDFLNTRILYRTEIEKLTKFQVIGELINDNQKISLVTAEGDRNFIVEQFRQIRSALKFQGNPKGNIKRTLVTSSIKGEGKSFVSSNLAVSLARSGKKVAILELDLHQPKLSEIFNISKRDGITDFLNGNARVEDIIYPTEIHPNLSLVPAGNDVDEPSELLVNGKLEVLLDKLDNYFDILIIDTVPVKALTDAYTIAAHCNLVLYIIRHNYTPDMFIEQLDTDMKNNNIANVALVFNGVKNRGWGGNPYGQGYGYGYATKKSYDSYKQKKKERA